MSTRLKLNLLSSVFIIAMLAVHIALLSAQYIFIFINYKE